MGIICLSVDAKLKKLGFKKVDIDIIMPVIYKYQRKSQIVDIYMDNNEIVLQTYSLELHNSVSVKLTEPELKLFLKKMNELKNIRHRRYT